MLTKPEQEKPIQDRRGLGLAVHIENGEWFMVPPGKTADAVQSMLAGTEFQSYRRLYRPDHRGA